MTTTPAGIVRPADRISRPSGDRRRILLFAAWALPVAWAALSIPLLLPWPAAPFVLVTLYLGLVPPALLLTRTDRSTSIRQLLRDLVRRPRRPWSMAAAILAVPIGTAVVAAALGAATPLSPGFVTRLALANVLSSVLIVNLAEELAWAGFVQRRAMSLWGYLRGSIVVALMFTAVHLPMAFYEASGPGDVLHGAGVMVVSGIGMRLLIGAADQWAGGSIVPLALIHGMFNASSELVRADHAWVRYAVTLSAGIAAAAVLLGQHRRNGHDEPVQR